MCTCVLKAGSLGDKNIQSAPRPPTWAQARVVTAALTRHYQALKNMNRNTSIFLILTLFGMQRAAPAFEFHVATSGNDSNRGGQTSPLRTIQRAAELAQPGDVITVHAGVYRERVSPPRGGKSDRKRIVYQASPGEEVEIRGSELIKNWVHVQNDVWKVILPNSFFGKFNPYKDTIHGDWFDPRGRPHHTGAVYLNGAWLVEAAHLEEVMAGKQRTPVPAESVTRWAIPQLWFAEADATNTTLWAQFQAVDPNVELVEINVRQTVFYPDQPGRNFITVRGFKMRHAATPWAPPTAQQVGLLGTHWSKGWIIESNMVSHSVCSGIALGKYGDEWDNTSANTAEGYVKTLERALQNGWRRDSIGHHVVRNNTISYCEQSGIVGSLGAAFSTITGNTLHDIHVRRLFSGAEMAGIKFHGAIDTVIRGNHVYRTCLGLWLDWMAQGTRVSGNLFHDNGRDLFVEVDHGPFVVDNNLFLSRASLLDVSEGGAYAHNLFNGTIVSAPEPNRQTPFHPAHSTAIAGLKSVKGGDDRFYNNIFIGHDGSASYGLVGYNQREYPLHTGGNVFYGAARTYDGATNFVATAAGLDVRLLSENDHVLLRFEPGPDLAEAETRLVTTELLGKAKVTGLRYEAANGAALKLNTDYFGKRRNPAHPTPGPFENPGTGAISLRVW